MTRKFQLSDTFLDNYKELDPKFGFNGVGELAYRRTYSRVKGDGTKENWWETIRRVVEWVYNTQKQHIEASQLGWEDSKATKSAEEMFDRMFHMKFLPPGRGLWIAGTEVLDKGNVAAALNNCAMISTQDIDEDLSKPFEFVMDMSMLGVGVGFDLLGAEKIIIREPNQTGNKVSTHQIGDTREGWVYALRTVLRAYFCGEHLPVFDYSKIRKKGEPIKGFGGTASGPEPLKELLDTISELLSKNIGKSISETVIADIMNLIGVCVVAGNVRRTAQLMLGKASSDEFKNLKNYSYDSKLGEYVGPMAHRAPYAWTSNNSIDAVLGMDYTDIAKNIAVNGEPGLIWVENAQKFSRMRADERDFKDAKAVGSNPCVEQTLESYELCCLVESFPTRCDDLSDYLRTLKFAYLYAKTVTLCNTHWPETNRVMMRNRRIGTSMSGIAQLADSEGLHALGLYCKHGYETIQHWDSIYSDWLCVPRSLKTTSVKPSGTVSLLAGCTPGIHWPESTTYIRRMRLAKDSDLIQPLRNANYPLLEDMSDKTVYVVEIPVKVDGVRKLGDVSMWEQLSMAAFMQEHWADNQVSATITFDPKTEGPQIANALNYFQYKLKGVSFLPRTETGAYHLMPYEEITEEEYNSRIRGLGEIVWSSKGEAASGERFCSNDTCTI